MRRLKCHSLVLWYQFVALANPWIDRKMHIRICIVTRQECQKYQQTCKFSLPIPMGVRSGFHWYDHLACIFIPSQGLEDFMQHIEGLTNYLAGFKWHSIWPLSPKWKIKINKAGHPSKWDFIRHSNSSKVGYLCSCKTWRLCIHSWSSANISIDG